MLPTSPLKLHSPSVNSSCGVVWQDVVQDLLHSGVALVELDSQAEIKAAAAFSSSSRAMDCFAGVDTQEPRIPESSDSSHATGYHGTGGLSARYNEYREGLVFSDNELFAVPEVPCFEDHCRKLQGTLHSTTEHVLSAIARHLEIPEDWFETTFGPTKLHSQWHMKRYVDMTDNKSGPEWLPTHTDPSLISVVVHDRRTGTGGDSRCGLQYSQNREWMDIPRSGHNVAVVLVGSVLQHITSNYFSGCLHRVIHHANAHGHERRMAATLFVRPAPSAILELPPAIVLSDRRTVKRQSFLDWNAKTARNYEKAKRKQKADHQT